jgi:hypothetical protein
MPWYRMGHGMVHLKLSGKAKKNPPKACPFFRWVWRDVEGSIVRERVKVRCMAMAPFLCDWPGCDVPICPDHVLELGADVHVCPTHNARRGLFSRLLPAPTGVSP